MMPGAILAEDELLSYPPLIQSAQTDLLTAHNDYELQEMKVKEQVSAFNAQVAGNPSLTNADKRNTELKALMAASNEYQENLKERDSLKFIVDSKRIELEYLQNMFRAHLAIVGGRLR